MMRISNGASLNVHWFYTHAVGWDYNVGKTLRLSRLEVNLKLCQMLNGIL